MSSGCSSTGTVGKFLLLLVSRRNTYNGRLYKEDPTIFAWDILNEPRQTAGDYSTVQKWIDMMASFVKSVDPNHMVRS